MMKRFLLLIAILVGVQSLTARTIGGRVVAEADTVPVDGAQCTLAAGDRQLAVMESVSGGQFRLSTPESGSMVLTVIKDGFDPTDIIIDSAQETIDLGIVWLTSGTTLLDEVTVEGSMEFDAKGRTIIFPGSADVKASESTLSLFQKLPLAGLSADTINRSISVMGSSPVVIINGVPSTLNELLLLQPKNIEKIEYSIIPPARYAAKGQTGYISVTLKKRDDGGQVAVWGRTAFTTTFVDGSIDASYHQGPSKFQISATTSWRNYQDVLDHAEESYIGTDGYRLDLNTQSRSPFNYFNLPIALKYTYAPKPTTVFSAAFNFNHYSDHRRSYGHTDDFLDDDYDFNNENRSKDLGNTLDLYYRQDFNSRHTLEAEMVGTLSNSRYDRTNTYDYLSGRTEDFTTDIHSDRRSLITDVSYTYNVSQQSELAAGLTNTLSHSSNRYMLTDYNPTLTENNNNLYVQYSRMFSRLYVGLRTGAQFNWLRNDDARRHYIRNLSSLQLQWTPAQTFTLSASANYSSGIPGLSAITDYEQQITPYLISNGNPDLKTSHNVYAALQPAVRYRKLTVSGLVSFSKVINGVFSDVSYLGDGMFLSRSVNSKKNDTWRGRLQVQMSDLAGFGFNATVQYSHYATAVETWDMSLASWSALLNLWYNYRNFTFSYYHKFPGKYLYAQTVGRDENGNALQVSYRPDRHWTFSLSWMYMFDGHGTKYPSWTYSSVNPSWRDRNIRENANMVCLSINYTADFGTIFHTARRTLNNSDSGSAILKL